MHLLKQPRFNISLGSGAVLLLLMMLLLCVHRSHSQQQQQQRVPFKLSDRVYGFIAQSYRDSVQSGFGRRVPLNPHQNASVRGTFENDSPLLRNAKEPMRYVRKIAVRSVAARTNKLQVPLKQESSEGDLNEMRNSSSFTTKLASTTTTPTRLDTPPSMSGNQTL